MLHLRCSFGWCGLLEHVRSMPDEIKLRSKSETQFLRTSGALEKQADRDEPFRQKGSVKRK